MRHITHNAYANKYGYGKIACCENGMFSNNFINVDALILIVN